MTRNFGGLLKVLHLAEFTLAVEQVLAICLLATYNDEHRGITQYIYRLSHNDIHSEMANIIRWEFNLAVSAQLRQS